MANELALGAVSGGVDDNLTAAGTTQATALALNATVNVVTTAGAGTGVSLPANRSRNSPVVVKNLGANALAVYPPASGSYVSTSQIDALGAGAAFSVGAGKAATFWPRGSDSYVGHLSA